MSSLKKEFNSLNLLFASISCMIGSGWLLSAPNCASIAGPASIVSWLIGGMIIIIIGICFARIAVLLPIAGGIARYSFFTHGRTTSFIIGWLAWLSCVACAPTEAQTIMRYIDSFIPLQFTHVQNNEIVLSYLGLAASAFLVLVLSIINILGIKTLIRFNRFMAIWKLIIPLVVVCIVGFNHFNTDNFTQYHGGWNPHGWHGILQATAQFVVFSFLGFREATSLAAETKNPERSIPIAVIGSVTLCMIIYIIMQIIFIGGLSSTMLSHGWASLIYQTNPGPWAKMATDLGLIFVSHMIFLDILISPTGSGLIYTATTARLGYAMGRMRCLPECMTYINSHGVPLYSIWVNFAVAMLLLPLYSWESLVKFQSVSLIIAYISGPISLYIISHSTRETIPQKWSHSFLFCYLVFFLCNMLIYWAGWSTLKLLVFSIAFGFSVLLFYRWKSKKSDLSMSRSIWLIPYFFGISLISYLGSYEGIAVLFFPFDALCIAILSAVILLLSHKSALPNDTIRYLIETESAS